MDIQRILSLRGGWKLYSQAVRLSKDFDLVENGDRIMVALSGGKDSYTLLVLLEAMRRRAPLEFSFVAVHLDQGQPGYDGQPLEAWLAANAFEHRILRQDTYSVVVDKIPAGKTHCSLCSRLRRGILYSAAQEMGCNKIALGHHRDDALETLLLNLFFSGVLRAMPPILRADDGKNIVIRPLLACAEDEIAAFARAMAFPILPCNLCGSQENLWRDEMRKLIDGIEARRPGVRHSMLAALFNVKAAHLLDRDLWKALGIHRGKEEASAVRAPGPRLVSLPVGDVCGHDLLVAGL